MDAFIDVQLCDDHALVRSGLRRLIEVEHDLRVTGEASTADEAVEHVRAAKPDVLLLDVAMPGKSGIEALPEIAAAAPGVKVLMLSMQDDPVYVRQAFAAGANGYLLKETADTELIQAIHDVAAGRRYLHPALAARLADAGARREPHSDADPLSDREHEVLRLLAQGHTNQEIAKLLFISIRTAETHRARIMQKLGLRTRAEVVRYALTAEVLHVEASSLAPFARQNRRLARIRTFPRRRT